MLIKLILLDAFLELDLLRIGLEVYLILDQPLPLGMPIFAKLEVFKVFFVKFDLFKLVWVLLNELLPQLEQPHDFFVGLEVPESVIHYVK